MKTFDRQFSNWYPFFKVIEFIDVCVGNKTKRKTTKQIKLPSITGTRDPCFKENLERIIPATNNEISRQFSAPYSSLIILFQYALNWKFLYPKWSSYRNRIGCRMQIDWTLFFHFFNYFFSNLYITLFYYLLN